jgi:hypothetical protein
MPTLPSLPAPNIKQIYIPATATDADGNAVPQEDQGWVKMDCSPVNVQDYIFTPDSTDKRNKEYTANILTERIKEWNFEENGAVLPIDQTNVVRLFQLPGTFSYLLSQIEDAPTTGLSTAEKKS